ncbi:MAG: hypothetical protein WCH62_08975 [Candidatus Omnitrophota bacterium]
MAESVLNQEEQRMDINKGSKDRGSRLYKMKRYLGIGLSVLMMGLTVYVFKLLHESNLVLSQSTGLALSAGEAQSSNYRSYVRQYKDTKIQLEETTRKLEAVTLQLNEVTAQLDTTKNLLAQTQTMLAQAQSENSKLKEDLQSLDGIKADQNVHNISELEARIATLKNKNTQADTELADLKSQLRAFQADFSTMKEGRSLITLFQNRIRLVKSRMHYLEQEAYFAKVAAQKERDRIAALNGNNGFVVHNGVVQKPNGTNKTFSIDVKMVQ